jgi:hypothetical protein
MNAEPCRATLQDPSSNSQPETKVPHSIATVVLIRGLEMLITDTTAPWPRWNKRSLPRKHEVSYRECTACTIHKGVQGEYICRAHYWIDTGIILGWYCFDTRLKPGWCCWIPLRYRVNTDVIPVGYPDGTEAVILYIGQDCFFVSLTRLFVLSSLMSMRLWVSFCD